MRKNKTLLLPLLLAAAALFGACGSDSETTYDIDTHDCVVTSMAMGTLKRSIPVKSSTGADSSYTVSVTGSLYPLFIDNVGNRIYNADSLPIGTDVSRVTFSALSSTGVATIRSLSTDKDTLFATTDSTDFTKIRQLTVNAYDGVSKKTYNVDIRVHQQAADSFVWNKCGTANSCGSEDGQPQRLLARADGTLLRFGVKAGQPVVQALQPEAAGWAETALPAGFDTRSVIADIAATAFYARTSDGRLLASADGTAWEEVPATFVPQTLLAAGTNAITALSGGQFWSSADGGRTWQADDCDEPENQPVRDIAAIASPTKTDSRMEQYAVVGRKANGEAVVWLRDIDITGENTFSWYCLPRIEQYEVNCPQLTAVSLFRYNDTTWLIGYTETGGSPVIYASHDNGRTWKADKLAFPSAETAASAAISATADKSGNIWLLDSADGTLWRGYYNKMKWNDEPGAYERAARR